jgi:transglutaminase-like putative cysteine protease
MTEDAETDSAGITLAVRHRTVFRYAGAVSNSVNTLHLEPRDFRFQKTLSAFIKVIPATRLQRFDDLFGNVTHHFELGGEHNKLETESMVKVRNLPLYITDRGYAEGLESYGDPSIRERCWQYLLESRWVSLAPEIWKQSLDLTMAQTAVFEKAAAIMRWIHDEFTYEPGTTDVETHLEQAFALRKGVCQDFTHVMIGMCRTIGLPARYASGYILTGGRDSLVGAQASHAWCEVHLPETGWIGFDPTNAVLADQRYVKIAVGRDYGDVAPIHGSYLGGAGCRMEVGVLVERV